MPIGQAAAFGLTLLVEAPIVWAGTGAAARGTGWRLAAALLPSSLTHPWAWRVLGHYGPHDHAAGLLLVEGIVWVVEVPLLMLLAGLSLRRAVGVSVAANAASLALGLLIT